MPLFGKRKTGQPTPTQTATATATATQMLPQTTPTPTPTQRASSTASTSLARWIEYDRASADLYAPSALLERRMLEDVIAPSLQAWAAYALGRTREPQHGTTLRDSADTFARWLLSESRDGKPLRAYSPAMVAHAWYYRLDEHERAALRAFALAPYDTRQHALREQQRALI